MQIQCGAAHIIIHSENIGPYYSVDAGALLPVFCIDQIFLCGIIRYRRLKKIEISLLHQVVGSQTGCARFNATKVTDLISQGAR
jgi:hypothetical protein